MNGLGKNLEIVPLCARFFQQIGSRSFGPKTEES